MTDLAVVLVTTPSPDKAADLARILVEERLVACGNVIPAVRSIYRWEGKVCDETEALLILKTEKHLFAPLRERIVALHPYQCPEVIQLPVEQSHLPYLEWIHGNLRNTK